MIGAVVAALLGLLLYLAIQYTGPSAVSDESLEADAVAAAEDGRGLEAAERYAELASRAMDNRERASWMLEQATALEAAEAPDQAAVVLADASQLDVGDEDLSNRIRLRLADLLVEAEDYAGASAVYNGMLDDSSTTPEYTATALLGLLDTSQAAGEPDVGWDRITAALERYPDNPEVALALARNMAEVLLARDRGTEAMAVLELLPGQDWEPLEQSSWLLTRARVHDDLGELDAALALYDEALAVVGDQGDEALLVRFEVAALRARRGDLDQALLMLQELDQAGLTGELQGLTKLQLADVLRQLDQRDAAEALYREVIDGWPELEDAVSRAREGLGALLLDAADGGEAAESLFVALEAGGDDADAAVDVLLGVANGQLALGEAETALSSFERIRSALADDSPHVIAADQGRAYALIQLDRNTDALELLRALRASTEADQRLLIDAQIGQTLLQAGQLEDAQAAFESLLEVAEQSGYGTSAAKLGLAEVAEAQERYEEALHLYQQVIANPQGQEQAEAALMALAPLQLSLGRDDDALLAYRQLVDLLPPDSVALDTIRVNMAEVYAVRGEIERERALWAEIMADASSGAMARGRLRLVELDMAEAAEAAEAGDAAGLEAAMAELGRLRGDPEFPADMVPDIIFGQVVCLFELQRYERAVETIQQSLEQGILGDDPEVFLTLRDQAEAALRGEPIDPDLADMPDPGSGPSDEEWEALLVRVEQAGALRDQGRYDQAMAAFDELMQTIEDRPTQASVQRSIAQTWAAQGQFEQAREVLEALSSEYAELDEAIFLAGLDLADLDLQEQDPGAALTRLATLDPPDEGHGLWKLQVLARAHSSAGDTDSALATWRQAIELAEGDPDGSVVAWTGLGDLYLQLGDTDKASDAFQRAAVLAPDGPARIQSQLRAAQVAVESGRLDEAQDVLDELQTQELEGEAVVQVALTLSALAQERGDWQAGLDAVAGVDTTRIGPDYQAMLVDARGMCARALGQLDDARAEYEALAQRWPDHSEADAVATFGLAELEAASGELDAASARVEQFVGRSPDRFRQGQALLRLAQAFENGGDAERAGTVYERVRDDYADEPELAQAAATALE